MARMIPKAPPDFHGSLGEERVFRALRSLPDAVVVIHSLRWLHPGNLLPLNRPLRAQGEGDFVVFDPGQGIMVVEVKGGEVWCEQGEWYQRNRSTGHTETIFPETQASNTAYRIRAEVLAVVPDANSLLFCHAVWFPDGVVDDGNLPMSYHPDTTMDADDLSRPTEAVRRAFGFWHSVCAGRKGVSGGVVERVLGVLAPSLSIVRSVRQTLSEREEQFVQLTGEQARILHFLDEQAHAAIIGAAGTGKTLLAIDKARRLALPTEPVLFLCYNSALREYLEDHHRHPNVRYLTFHGFARETMGPEGTLDDAVQGLIEHIADDKALPYEHLVVDEGQDFDRDWLEFLRYRFRDGAFYVFYDRYQAVQGRGEIQWLEEVPCRLVLTRNCRNTDPVAKVAYRAGGLSIAPTLGLQGPRPVLHRARDEKESVQIVNALVESACNHHKLPPQEVAVLTLTTINEGSLWDTDRLAGISTAKQPREDCVTVTTVRRFKGLEATLVLVVDVDLTRADDEEWRRRLYVACSRARHAVHIVTMTQESELGEAVRAFAGTEKVRTSWRALSRHLGISIGDGGNNDPFIERRTE